MYTPKPSLRDYVSIALLGVAPLVGCGKEPVNPSMLENKVANAQTMNSADSKGGELDLSTPEKTVLSYFRLASNRDSSLIDMIYFPNITTKEGNNQDQKIILAIKEYCAGIKPDTTELGQKLNTPDRKTLTEVRNLLTSKGDVALELSDISVAMIADKSCHIGKYGRVAHSGDYQITKVTFAIHLKRDGKAKTAKDGVYLIKVADKWMFLDD